MLKYPLIIGFLFSCAISFAQQKPLAPDSGFTNKAEAKNVMAHGVKEGKWVEYYAADGKTRANAAKAFCYCLTVYKSGKPYGIVRWYYKSGIIAGVIPYVHGKKNGVATWYYETGGPELETPYVNGIQNGIEKSYYPNGMLQYRGNYSNGKANGIWKMYFANGVVVKAEIPYKDNVLNGTEKWYYDDGKLKSETTYTNGKAGKTINYDEDGTLK